MIINFSNLGGGGGGGYVLPIASATRLGGVKIGSGVTIDAGGVISVDVPSSNVLKSISELPSTAETGDVVAVAVSGESYPNGITFEARTYEGGLQGGRFTFPLDSLSAYTLDNPYILGSVTGYYEGQGLAEVVLYAYNPEDEYLNIVFSPNPDGSDPYDPYTNIYMGPNESGEETAVCGVTFNYVYDDVNMQMVVDIYPYVEEPADEVVFDGIHSGETILGVFQYDGTDWQAVGGGSYTAGDYIEISDGTISVTGVTSRADFEEASEVISTALNDLQANKANFDDLATKQSYFTAATVADMNAIQSPKVGDICLKVENFTAVDMEAFYDYASQGNSFGNTLEHCGYSFGSYGAIKFTSIDNPNVGGSPISNYPGNASFYQFYWADNQSVQLNIQTNFEGSDVQYLKNGIFYTFGTAPVVISGLKGSNSGGGSGGDWYKLFLSTANTQYSKVLTMAIGEAAATYQFRDDNAWHLITEEADAAMKKAQDAENIANQKVSNNGSYVSSWSELQYQSTFIGDVTVNNVSQGYRIHSIGANTEYTNPRVDQIVTSDSFLRVMKMTQQEYDDLQTYDPLVCYIIVENQ